MKQMLAITCFFIFCSLHLQAQENWPDHFYSEELPNGLQVLVVEDPSVPLVTIELAVKNGSINETPENNGLAHLYEHLFFKANEAYPTQDSIMNRIEELGLVFNATTSDERVNYFINLSNDRLEEGLEFMSAAVRQPIFSEDEIENEQSVIESKFQRAESNPVHFLIKDINAKLWGEHASRKNAIGERDVIFNATPAQLNQMHDQYYVPGNSIIIVAGDVDHEAVFQHTRDAFGDWNAGGQGGQPISVPEFEPLSSSESVITINENAQSPIIISGFRGPTTRSDQKATYAADVLTYMLSQNRSALNQELVASGLAYQVGVGYTTQKYAAPFTIFMVPKAQGIPEAIKALEANIARMDDPEYFTDEELANAKRMLTIQELYSREAASEIVHNISYWWASADIDYFVDYTNNIQQVSREDIAALVNTYIKGQPNVTGILLTYEMKEMLRLNNFTPLNTQQ